MPLPPGKRVVGAVRASHWMRTRLRNPCTGRGLPRRAERRADPPTDSAAEAFDDLEQDVRQSIARIKASPFIPRKEQVRGFVYDVKTGALDEVS